MQVALTIAGSDSGGGAGIQADLRTFAAHRIHGASAITAITAQNSVGVIDWSAVDLKLVASQIEAVATDMKIAATKTGMLANAGIVHSVVRAAKAFGLGPLIVDPVMVAKSGDKLLDSEAIAAYVGSLFPIATLITPNLRETEVLLGRAVTDVAQMREAARDLLETGANAVLVKGGALEGQAIDVFTDGDRMVEIPGPWVDTPNVHGAGCTLSAAICARVAAGLELLEAVRSAKSWLVKGLARSYKVGRGRGPVNHLHEWI